MDIHILGGGLLARFVIEIVESTSNMNIAGIYDDGYPVRKKVLGYKILGKIDHLDYTKSLNLAVGIGDPKIRKKFIGGEHFKGCTFPSLVHKTALVSEYSQIGKGVIIGPFTSVLNGSRIGQGCCILSHSNINQDVIMEDFCLVGAGTLIGNGVHIGEGCHLGLGSKIHLNRKLEAWTHHE
jgi:acetyltransferase-like isoleucine patch superfamily enzyme